MEQKNGKKVISQNEETLLAEVAYSRMQNKKHLRIKDKLTKVYNSSKYNIDQLLYDDIIKLYTLRDSVHLYYNDKEKETDFNTIKAQEDTRFCKSILKRILMIKMIIQNNLIIGLKYRYK